MLLKGFIEIVLIIYSNNQTKSVSTSNHYFTEEFFLAIWVRQDSLATFFYHKKKKKKWVRYRKKTGKLKITDKLIKTTYSDKARKLETRMMLLPRQAAQSP